MERNLDQLSVGESAVISMLDQLKPKARLRLTMLGLTEGTTVMLSRRAPSGDPLVVRVRGYMLSLRRSDAKKICITGAPNGHRRGLYLQKDFMPTGEAAKLARNLTEHFDRSRCGLCENCKQKHAKAIAESIRAALTGNPNCGKTTLFNMITGAREAVGNHPGITVEIRERLCETNQAAIRLVDLPGIYSLQSDAAEERTAKTYLQERESDVIINIADATNLSRSLYLTMELRTLGRPMVLALNMMDEAKAQGISIDHVQLAELLGIPVIPICARSGEGVDTLLNCAIAVLKSSGMATNTARDTKTISDAAAIYAHIDALCHTCVTMQSHPNLSKTNRIDAVLTHRIFGIPILIGLLGLIFLLTFDTIGAYLSDGMERIISYAVHPWLAALLQRWHAPPAVASFLLHGMLDGIGGVITFLPQVGILFLCLSLLEDSGYLARAAFLTDRALRRFGLSGKACVPLLMGFGCTVPAALATRTMERNSDRSMTLFLLPYISCSAKLPVYGMIASIFFAKHRGWIVLSLYALGIGVGAVVGKLLHGTILSREEAAFTLELPPYRRPTARNIFMQVADRLEHFIKRAGTLILGMNLLLWILLHMDSSFNITVMPANSLLGRFGIWIAPIFAPLGFGTWQVSVALLTGLAAKEAVNASLTMFAVSSEVSVSQALSAWFTPASAYAFLVFLLLSIPCAAAIATLSHEWKNRRMTACFLVMQSCIAYITTYLIHTLLRLLWV